MTEGVKPKNSISQMFVGSAFDPSPHGFHEAGTIPINPWLGAPWNPLLINALKSGRKFHSGLATANS